MLMYNWTEHVQLVYTNIILVFGPSLDNRHQGQRVQSTRANETSQDANDIRIPLIKSKCDLQLLYDHFVLIRAQKLNE